MDLDVMASVQENIIGNCLCVLGDSMAMPVGVDDQALPAGVRSTYANRPPVASRRAGSDGTTSDPWAPASLPRTAGA